MIGASAAAGGLKETLIQLADPWSKLFSHSKPLSAGVLFLHLVPLIIAAGVAYSADRATIRASRAGAAERVEQLRQLAAIHRVVLTGLAISFTSGLLLLLSDVEAFFGSVFLIIKLACVGLLLLNGFLMTRTEQQLAGSGTDEALWGRMRTFAMLSAILWIATTLAGVVLKEFA